ncbi:MULTISPECIES: hypothetical protein [Peribacillus]|uniref:hypothetical protein n=1 Tax=Peribacillus TaxID=2675229 RepID=UPI00159539DB|nr:MULTISPECIES: hypothetical protein [Peribacillus]MBD8591681.1 hypothetical protein [Peribacillus simplex]MCM3169618.1 hypothetical protein [Peribacillus frigoritolerans]
MTLLFQSLGFGVLFGLVMLLANHDKPNKLLIFLKYFLIGTGGHFLYEWILG